MLTLGASLAGTNDWSYPPVWFLLIAGLVVMVVTVFHEARTPEAVIPPQLFQNSIFTVFERQRGQPMPRPGSPRCDR